MRAGPADGRRRGMKRSRKDGMSTPEDERELKSKQDEHAQRRAMVLLEIAHCQNDLSEHEKSVHETLKEARAALHEVVDSPQRRRLKEMIFYLEGVSHSCGAGRRAAVRRGLRASGSSRGQGSKVQ